MRAYFQPAFLICVAVLLAGELIKPILGVVIADKEPLPLKKPLEFLDEKNLSPYRVISKVEIDNKQLIEELGTKDYIQWILEDTEASIDSAVRNILLFITYYDLPDKVVHAPEECYMGGGFEKLSSDNITFEVNAVRHSVDNKSAFARRRSRFGGVGSSFRKDIHGKYLVFGSTKSDFWQPARHSFSAGGRRGKFPVLYFFRVNGKYMGSREETRITLNKNIFGKFSYFSKVELAFNQGPVTPDKEGALAAGEKLLGVILPILEAEHWPDWPVLPSGDKLRRGESEFKGEKGVGGE